MKYLLLLLKQLGEWAFASIIRCKRVKRNTFIFQQEHFFNENRLEMSYRKLALAYHW